MRDPCSLGFRVVLTVIVRHCESSRGFRKQLGLSFILELSPVPFTYSNKNKVKYYFHLNGFGLLISAKSHVLGSPKEILDLDLPCFFFIDHFKFSFTYLHSTNNFLTKGISWHRVFPVEIQCRKTYMITILLLHARNKEKRLLKLSETAFHAILQFYFIILNFPNCYFPWIIIIFLVGFPYLFISFK